MKVKSMFFLISALGKDAYQMDQRNEVDITIGENQYSPEQVGDYIEKYKKQVDLLTNLSDKGNREAKFTLGNILLLTYNPYSNESTQLEKARNYLQESGYADAFWTLANTYNNPVIGKPQINKYLENMKASADLQSPSSKYEYALALYSFFGDDRKEEVIKYLKEANDSNYPNALFLSSILHSQGNLVEKDEDLANFFLIMAAQHDDLPAAKFILALKALELSNEEPAPEIYILLMQAASLGHAYSQKFLEGLFNQNNESFDETIENSLESYMRNCYSPKILPVFLKNLYNIEPDAQNLEEILTQKIASDNKAIFLLALKNENDQRLSKNELLKIYEKAALGGMKEAWVCMGRLELFGYKDEKGDLGKAAEYLLKAEEAGDNNALIGLALVTKNQGDSDFLEYLKEASNKKIPIADLYLLNLRKKISDEPINILAESNKISQKYSENLFTFLEQILKLTKDYYSSPIFSSSYIKNASEEINQKSNSADNKEDTKTNEKSTNKNITSAAEDANADNFSGNLDNDSVSSAGQDVAIENMENGTTISSAGDISMEGTDGGSTISNAAQNV